MNKKELRKRYIEIRKNIKNKEERDIEIFNKVINLEEYKKSKLIFTYVSLKEEVDTIKLIEYSLESEKQVAVPKCEGDIIRFYQIKSIEELKEGSFGVLEPDNNNLVTNFENNICFVPGVCFDKENNRIGYGKGYYDRFLKEYQGTKIGITYKECICNKIESNEYDVKLDKIIMG